VADTLASGTTLPAERRTPLLGITARGLVITLGLSFVASLWINQAEIITHFCQISEAVPPIPALAFLLLLAGAAAILRKVSPRLALKRREILLIFIGLAVAATMPGCGIGRFFFNTLPVLFYFDTPTNDFAAYQKYMPEWMVPHDPEVIRRFYEASEGGAVPWRAWLGPLSMWSVFFLAFFIVMLSISTVLERQWSEKEKLVYPLLYIPLEVTRADTREQGQAGFWTSPIMWTGFSVAFLYDVTNMLNAYNPGLPAMGQWYDLGAVLTERPWSALAPVLFQYRPELIGLGYLVSTEIAFSTWASFVLIKLEHLLLVVAGFDMPEYPLAQEQSLGAYIALFMLMVYVGRHHLRHVWHHALAGGPERDEGDDPVRWRTVVLGGIAAFLVVIIWLAAAGLAPWLAITYMAIVLMLAVVYARIRAEAGAPVIWLFPYYQAFKGITNFLGSAPLEYRGSWRSATIFATLVFMSRGYYSSMIGYQVEGLRLARATGIRRTAMTWMLVFGLMLGIWVCLTGILRSYYEYGAGGLSSMSDWGTGQALDEYGAVVSYATAPASPKPARMAATGVGFVTATGLFLVRTRFLRFPLHPLGFAMVTAWSTIWAPFLVVWVIKSLVLRLGGMRLYRTLIPGFIGLALGHYFTAGVLWGLLGSYGGPAVHGFGVPFG